MWHHIASDNENTRSGYATREWVRPTQEDAFYWRVSEEHRGAPNNSFLAFLTVTSVRYYLRKCEADGEQIVLLSVEGDYESVQDAQEAAALKESGMSREQKGLVLPN